VIFDEASQVFPRRGSCDPRGTQVIVVGDQHQLPPSHFFRKDDRDEEDSEDDDDEPEVQNRLVGVESILDVLVGLKGAGVDGVYLEVHYRSRHDNLIRYSNHYFYGDRLLTFPSAHSTRPGLGLRSVYVPTGRFDAGASRTNRVEAERVVELAFELMETRPPSESIGVVALSRAQTDLIEELLDQRRLADRRFDARFSEDARERFFVKNLENVQGDERDHIILSVGYGPTTATGLVPNRFGPVNAEGGQRRLNVAVSRARRSMTVVHSLRPEDIRSETEGARLLRRYLEFLRDGAASLESAVTENASGEAESPFEDAVGRALEARGYRIHRQVGCSKYAIDIAVRSEMTLAT
jgi:superfamily I DNA and/or RNA helicase